MKRFIPTATSTLLLAHISVHLFDTRLTRFPQNNGVKKNGFHWELKSRTFRLYATDALLLHHVCLIINRLTDEGITSPTPFLKETLLQATMYVSSTTRVENKVHLSARFGNSASGIKTATLCTKKTMPYFCTTSILNLFPFHGLNPYSVRCLHRVARKSINPKYPLTLKQRIRFLFLWVASCCVCITNIYHKSIRQIPAIATIMFIDTSTSLSHNMFRPTGHHQ
jgi:hypothetical protein